MAHAPLTIEPAPSGPLTLHGQSVEGVDRCVHCGLCLAYCPTFSELGTEMDSPRGRILLIKSLAEGRIALTDSATAHLDLCLGCRACGSIRRAACAACCADRACSRSCPRRSGTGNRCCPSCHPRRTERRCPR